MDSSDSEHSTAPRKGGKRSPAPVVGLVKSQRRQKIVLEALGIKTEERDRAGQQGLNPHVVTQGVRQQLEWVAANKLQSRGFERVRVAWPREGEFDTFKNRFDCVPFRGVLTPNDLVEGRREYPYQPWRAGEAFFVGDVYFYDIAGLYDALRLEDHPDMDAGGLGVQGYMRLKDFRGHLGFDQMKIRPTEAHLESVKVRKPLLEGNKVVVHPEIPKKEVRAWNRPGTPYMVDSWEDIEVPAEAGFTFTEGYWKRPGYGQEKGAPVETAGFAHGRVETNWSHPVRTDEFFDLSEVSFSRYGREVGCSIHVQTVSFNQYLLSVRYFPLSSGQPELRQCSGLTSSAFVIDGVAMPVMTNLIGYTMNLDPSNKAQMSTMSNRVSRAVAELFKDLPVDQLKGWPERQAQIIKATFERLVAMRMQADLAPGNVGMEDSVVSFDTQKYVDRGIPRGLAKLGARLQHTRTKVAFVVETAVSVWEWIKELFSILKEKLFSRVAEFSEMKMPTDLCLNLVELLTNSCDTAHRLYHSVAGKVEGFVGRARNVFRKPMFSKARFLLDEIDELFWLGLLALGEEVLKRIVPFFAFILSFAEACVVGVKLWIQKEENPMEAVDWAHLVIQAVLRIAAHVAFTYLSLPIAVFVHMFWNYVVRNHKRFRGLIVRVFHEWKLERWMRENPVETGPYLEEDEGTQAVNDKLSERLVCVTPVGSVVAVGSHSAGEFWKREDFVSLPRKVRAVGCESSAMLARPVSTVSAVAMMIGTRLDVDVPTTTSTIISGNYAVLREAVALRGPVRAMGVQEFRAYIDSQPFSVSKKARYAEMIDAYELDPSGWTSTKKDVVFLKSDEVLGKKSLKGRDDAYYVKGRPIFPLSQRHLEAMMFIVEFKKLFREPFEWDFGHWTLTLWYNYDGPPDNVEKRVNAIRHTRGIHVLDLGDDVLIIRVDDSSGNLSSIRGAAADMKSCDLTCGPEIQEEQSEIWVENGFDAGARERYLKNLTGRFRVQCSDFDPEAGKLYLDVKRPSTTTGHPCTSVIAMTAILSAGAEAGARASGGSLRSSPLKGKSVLENMSGMDSFLRHFRDVCTENGHILEWEGGCKFHPLPAVSFLGGHFFFSYEKDQFIHVSLNFWKACLFPDVERMAMYQDHQDPLAAHALAFSEAPIFKQSPVGRALGKLYTTYAAQNGLGLESRPALYERLKQTYSWYDRIKSDSQSVSQINEADFYDGVDQYCRAIGIRDGASRLRTVQSEIEDLANEFAVALPTTLYSEGGIFYALRAGEEINSKWLDLAELNILGLCLGERQKRGVVFDLLMGSQARSQAELIAEANKKKEKAEARKLAKRVARDIKDVSVRKSTKKAPGPGGGRTALGQAIPKNASSKANAGGAVAQAPIGSLASESENLYYTALDNPRAVDGAKLPATPAGRAAVDSLTVQTTTVNTLSVGNTSTDQLSIFAHGTYSDNDDVAFHGRAIRINNGGAPSVVCPGPVTYGAAAPGGAVAAIHTGGANVGNCWFDTLPNTTVGVPWGASVPFGGDTEANHLRYRLVALEVSWKNTTPDLERAGSVTSVQPSHQMTWANDSPQAQFTKFPTFAMHGNKKGSVKFLPTAEDFEYWHVDPVAGYIEDLRGASIMIWFNGGGANANTYEFTIVASWELTGSTIESILTPAVNVPGAIDRLIDSTEVMRNSGAAGAYKSKEHAHCAAAAGMVPAVRKSVGLPSTDDGIRGMIKKLLGATATSVIGYLLP